MSGGNPLPVEVSFQSEGLRSFWDDAQGLLRDHWEEIAHYRDIKLDPDFDLYAAAEAGNMLRIYTVRADEKLVGYAVFFVRTHPHYKQSITATGDVLFLHPDYRQSLIANRLVKFTEGELTREGVDAIYHHVKVKHPALGVLLARMGYEKIEENFGKRVG